MTLHFTEMPPERCNNAITPEIPEEVHIIVRQRNAISFNNGRGSVSRLHNDKRGSSSDIFY
jgi:hypothetical protein